MVSQPVPASPAFSGMPPLRDFLRPGGSKGRRALTGFRLGFLGGFVSAMRIAILAFAPLLMRGFPESAGISVTVAHHAAPQAMGSVARPSCRFYGAVSRHGTSASAFRRRSAAKGPFC